MKTGRNNSGTSAIYVRVPTDLLKEFDEVAQDHGMSRSEAIREAMKIFIRFAQAPQAKKIKGILSGAKIGSNTLLNIVAP